MVSEGGLGRTLGVASSGRGGLSVFPGALGCAGSVWTGDVPKAWLEEPNIPEEQRVTAAINLKLRLGQ